MNWNVVFYIANLTSYLHFPLFVVQINDEETKILLSLFQQAAINSILLVYIYVYTWPTKYWIESYTAHGEYTFIYTYMYTYTFTLLQIYSLPNIGWKAILLTGNVHIYIYTYICVYLHTYLYIYIYIYIYIYSLPNIGWKAILLTGNVHIYIYTYIYVYLHTYIHI
jgi:hypothetical protein